MGEATEGRVCAGGCGRKLRQVNKTGYCERCWRKTPAARAYLREWRSNNWHSQRTAAPCGVCGKTLNASSRNGLCTMCWRKTPEGRAALTDNRNRWDRERMAIPEAKMKYLVDFANARARRAGLPHGMTAQDLLPFPTVCPVLGIALDYARGPRRAGSASIDRINPSLGYVAGNVRIISWRANSLKKDGTPDELYAVAMDAMRVAKRIV